MIAMRAVGLPLFASLLHSRAWKLSCMLFQCEDIPCAQYLRANLSSARDMSKGHSNASLSSRPQGVLLGLHSGHPLLKRRRGSLPFPTSRPNSEGMEN
jgi:hypothetical protein